MSEWRGDVLGNEGHDQQNQELKSTVSKPPMPIIVTVETKKKRATPQNSRPAKPAYEPQNLFSDETAKFLLRLIKGKDKLPEKIVLPKNTKQPNHHEESGKKSGKQQDIQEELATAIREILLPWFWSFLFHICLFICLALLFFHKTKDEAITISLGIDEIPASFIRDFPLGVDPSPVELPTLIVPQELPPVEMPKTSPPKVETATETESVTVTAENSPEVPSGFSLRGREIGS
ncbi:MAG: hypothetical protein LBQ50_00015, partial [Planctomycetaceae bacterium]|nr:hypothetical protein [Planctomycetaceae bacterium]